MPIEISIDPEGDPEDETTDPAANPPATVELPLPTIEELPQVMVEPSRALEPQGSIVQHQFDSVPVNANASQASMPSWHIGTPPGGPTAPSQVSQTLAMSLPEPSPDPGPREALE